MKMRTILPLIVLVLASVVPFSASAQNSCTECHSTQMDPWLWPIYQDWAKSPHREEGITCDRCHGGEPSSLDIEEAHGGVLGPSDPESKIHYSNIISMCGECHTEIGDYYTQSKHYQNLVEGKLAPDCRTCMGSHDVTLDPTHIVVSCEKCMNPENSVSTEPLLKGTAAHSMMTATEKEIYEAEKLLKLSRERGLNLSVAEKELENAKAGIGGHEAKFHAFDPEGLIPELTKAYNSAVAAREIAQQALEKGPSVLTLFLVIAGALVVGTSILFGGIIIVSKFIAKRRFQVEKR